jgi:hypothetical protein
MKPTTKIRFTEPQIALCDAHASKLQSRPLDRVSRTGLYGEQDSSSITIAVTIRGTPRLCTSSLKTSSRQATYSWMWKATQAVS